jgi:uncharacterized protein (TIGR02231 family)
MSAIAATPIAIAAPVDRVTVFEDRAQVTRTGRVRLAAGRHILCVSRVTPLVVDRTLRARCRTSDGAAADVRLVDLRVKREATVAATRPELPQALQQKLDALRDFRDAELRAVRLAEAEGETLRTARANLLQAACRQAGRGLDRRESWAAGLARITAELERNAEELERRAAAAENLGEQERRLLERLALAAEPSICYFATLLATVECAADGEHEIAWEYLVPCAAWRPSHQAELSDGKLHWRIGGTVWQHTGELWDKAALRLSTERPALGAEVPLLDEDLLRLRPRTDREKQAIEVTTRDEAIEVVAPGLEPGRTTGAMPGVDDGGETRVFELAHPVTIPSDGRAHLVELGSFEAAPEVDLLCVPEAAPAVLLRSQQPNAGAWPLLAGPVRLVRNGVFSGHGQTELVAPGERFALGWGSIDDLQVARRTGEHTEETALTRRTRRSVWVDVFLSNLGQTPQRVTVLERIPVSEVEQVKISLDAEESSAGWRADEHGHVRLTVDLAPTAHAQLRLRYAVDAHRKVVWR